MKKKLEVVTNTAVTNTLARVRRLSPEAEALLQTLPEAVLLSLVRGVPSPKLLAIGILAAAKRSPTSVLGLRFHIPEEWVIRQRDACLQAMQVLAEAGRHTPPAASQDEKQAVSDHRTL